MLAAKEAKKAEKRHILPAETAGRSCVHQAPSDGLRGVALCQLLIEAAKLAANPLLPWGAAVVSQEALQTQMLLFRTQV